MGWKWNNYRAKLQTIGLTAQQIDAVEAIATAKKWELVDILEKRIAETSDASKKAAFQEVIDGVKPHGNKA